MEIDPHNQAENYSNQGEIFEEKKSEEKISEEKISGEKNNSEKVTVSYKQESSSLVLALALDVGRKRIGVAGCDRTGLIATGLTTIERTSFERDVEQIRQLVRQRQINVLVVGLPYSMDGSLGFQARQVKKFAYRVGKALELPIEYVDERLTSYQAEQLIIAEKRSPSRNKGLIDRKAASLILQRWLDARVKT